VAVGDPTRAPAFADHDGDVGVQVDAADGQADDLGAVQAIGFRHEADERGIPQLAAVPSLACFEQLAQVLDWRGTVATAQPKNCVVTRKRTAAVAGERWPSR
jgi:hypothetical protein